MIARSCSALFIGHTHVPSGFVLSLSLSLGCGGVLCVCVCVCVCMKKGPCVMNNLIMPTLSRCVIS